MKPVAAPIIRRHTLQLLEERAPENVSLRDIRAYVEEAAGEKFTLAMFSGALRDLVIEQEGRVTNPERGFYRYNANAKREQISQILNKARRELDKVAFGNYLMLSAEEKETLKLIPVFDLMLQQSLDVLHAGDPKRLQLHVIEPIENIQVEFALSSPPEKEPEPEMEEPPTLASLGEPRELTEARKAYLDETLVFRDVEYYVENVTWSAKNEVPYVHLRKPDGNMMYLSIRKMKHFKFKGDESL